MYAYEVCVVGGECTHAFARHTGGGQRATLSIGPHLLPCLRQVLLFVVHCQGLQVAGPKPSGDSPVSTSHPTVGELKLRLQVHFVAAGF